MNSRFIPPVLDNTQVQEALDCLQLLTARLEMFRLGNSPVRLLVDGDQRLRFHPKAELQTAFTIPEDSGFVELRGDDDQGDLLLAALLVPERFLEPVVDRIIFPHTSGGVMEIAISWLNQKARSARRFCHLGTNFDMRTG
jgi:hypothetical protein